MYNYNDNTENNNPSKTGNNNKFLGTLSKFIHAVESELAIMLPGSASLQFLSDYTLLSSVTGDVNASNIELFECLAMLV
jgi:hypothetical protein